MRSSFKLIPVGTASNLTRAGFIEVVQEDGTDRLYEGL